jgi:hypothetical protein
MQYAAAQMHNDDKHAAPPKAGHVQPQCMIQRLARDREADRSISLMVMDHGSSSAGKANQPASSCRRS